MRGEPGFQRGLPLNNTNTKCQAEGLVPITERLLASLKVNFPCSIDQVLTYSKFLTSGRHRLGARLGATLTAGTTPTTTH